MNTKHFLSSTKSRFFSSVLILGLMLLSLITQTTHAAAAVAVPKQITLGYQKYGSLIILNSALFALRRERRFARNMPPL